MMCGGRISRNGTAFAENLSRAVGGSNPFLGVGLLPPFALPGTESGRWGPWRKYFSKKID